MTCSRSWCQWEKCRVHLDIYTVISFTCSAETKRCFMDNCLHCVAITMELCCNGEVSVAHNSKQIL